MSKFEYLMMITSVVVAVGLAEIIAGWGRLLRAQYSNIKFDWLHGGFSAIVVVGLIQHWAGIWAYKDLEIVHLGKIVFLMLPSFFLVLTAYAISPEVRDGEDLDCRDFYFSKHKSIWFSWSGFIVLSVMADFIIIGYSETFISGHIPYLLPLLGGLLLAFTKNKWCHLSIFTVFFLATIVSLFMVIGPLAK